MSSFHLPEPVRARFESYQSAGERYQVLPAVVKIQDQVFYCASYHMGNQLTGYLFVLDNGQVPALNETVKTVLETAVGTMHVNRMFYGTVIGFGGVARRKYRYTKVLLKWLDRLGNNSPTEMKDSIKSFQSVLITLKEEQAKIREIASLLDNELKQIDRVKVLTPATYQKVRDLLYRIGKAAFLQTYTQLQTYHDRVRVIRYLTGNGKFLKALILWFFHIRYHRGQVKDGEREDFEFSVRRFLHNQESDRDEKEIERCLSITRNPK